ncbi:MAG: MarR family transcriptional regulator [Deltaproteobacteria bacterium]|nr:MarR family transcriptional regulator [Deltaproteobacteria bacterium]
MEPQSSSTADIEVLTALRRVLRAVSIHSRQMARSTGLTVPQVLCLRALSLEEPLTSAQLAQRLQVSPATLTGLVDRLVEGGLVRRRRGTHDRRQVHILLSEAGRQRVGQMPRLLQERFVEGFLRLCESERCQILRALDRIAELMGAADLDAAPILSAEDTITDPGA